MSLSYNGFLPQGRFSILSWILLSVLAVGCSGRDQPPSDLFGDPQATRSGSNLTSADLGPYLALSRAVVAGQSPATVPGMTDRAGQRVFVTAWGPEGHARIGTGLGKTLQESVVQAASQARASVGSPDGIRLQLDVVTSAEADPFADEIKPEPREVGDFGYLLSRDARTLGYVLPGEIVTRELYDWGKKARLRRVKIGKLIAERAHVEVEALKGFKAWRFSTLSVIESNPPGRVLPLLRGMVLRPEKIDADLLLNATRLAADYLVRVEAPDGRYIYAYQTLDNKPGRDEDGADYNMLRHCGTTYSLLEAYEALHDPRYLEAAERAIGYLKGRLRPRPDWVPGKPGLENFVHLVDEDKAETSKIGGAGLALIALARHAAVTGKGENLETMRGIARFILYRQEENGHFLSYFQHRPDRKVSQKDILYYPGEAMLGLMRLYALDPDPRWLAAVRLGADYLINTRDVKKSEDNIDHDHWLSYALNEVYRVTRSAPYAEHAFKIARAIELKQKKKQDAPAPDFVGGFYKMPNSTPASVRLEAFYADITLARFMGRPEASLLESATEVAGFVESQQFDEQNSYFLPDPAMALGGVRESLVNNDVRIDYVQHAMSGMLGFARILQDPSFGKTGVPGVLPVKALTMTPQPATPTGTTAGAPAATTAAGISTQLAGSEASGGGSRTPVKASEAPANAVRGASEGGRAGSSDRDPVEPAGEE